MGTISELKKALTHAGDGAELAPYDLDPYLHEELVGAQPLMSLMSILQAEGPTHEYRVRSSHPMGWFEGEVTPANPANGTYARKTVAMKIARIWGSVSGFAQKADEKFINALETELAGSVQGMADVFEYGILHGTADDIGFTGDPYQYSGILPRLFAYAPENVIDGGGAKVTLDMLDQVIAKAAKFRQVKNDPAFWAMGTRMKQVVDGLQSKVQIPLRSQELFDGKLIMGTYAGRPIYETDYLASSEITSSPAVTAAKAAGGELTAGAYKYAISSVTAYGEAVASALSSAATTETTNLKVNLTWTADANAKAYMIWRTEKDANVPYLLDIIPAKTYDSAGTVNGSVETYSDLGTRTLNKSIEPLLTGEQQILFVNTNPVRGAAFVGLIDDMGRQIDGLLNFVELARVKDSYDYMLKNYGALRLVHPNLAGVIRHVKVA